MTIEAVKCKRGSMAHDLECIRAAYKAISPEVLAQDGDIMTEFIQETMKVPNQELAAQLKSQIKGLHNQLNNLDGLVNGTSVNKHFAWLKKTEEAYDRFRMHAPLVPITPSRGDYYWYVNDVGGVYTRIWDCGAEDKARAELGNVFDSELKAREKVKELQEHTHRRLRRKDLLWFRFSLEGVEL